MNNIQRYVGCYDRDWRAGRAISSQPQEDGRHLMKFKKSSTTYLIEIPLEEFTDLLDYESPWGGNASETLYARLRNMGVESDYDAHYSSIISVDIHIDDDDSDFQDEIAETIKDQLEKASKWKKSETA